MQSRSDFLRVLAARIVALPQDRTRKVAIDGVDGAGKTTLADELASLLQSTGRPIVRASVDSFHHPRVLRYRLGRASPEGFFQDSYDYRALRDSLLDPFGRAEHFKRAHFDHLTDSYVDSPSEEPRPGSILIFDGIFLHRPELRDYWDFSVFLDVAFGNSIPRGAQRGPGFGSPDPSAPENRRYVEGQKLYLRSCDPARHATLKVNYNDLSAPFIQSSPKTRVILSDLDGVLRKFPVERDVDIERRHGLSRGAIATHAFARPLLDQAVTGLIRDEEWRERIAASLASVVPQETARAAVAEWSDFPGVVNTELLDHFLKQDLKRAILTNGTTRVRRDLACLDLDRHFDAIFNTAEIGFAKPDPRIYAHVASALGCSPEDIFFIDDNPSMILGAAECGFQTHLYRGMEPLRKALPC